MRNFLSYATIKNIFTWALAHKVISALIAVAILGGGYWTYTTLTSTTGEMRYILGTVEKSTIIASISASGQVSASNQLAIQAKASGEIISINVSPSQKVAAGALIAVLDPTAAQKAVRDAEVNLESAQLSLEKLQKPADALSTLQAENSLMQAKNSEQKAEDNIKKAYEDGFNTVSDAFLKLPGVMTGLDNIFFDEGDFEPYQWNIDWYLNRVSLNNRDKATHYRDDVTAAYNKARTTYTKNFDDYKAASRTSDTQTIESLISETYETTKLIAEAVKVSNNYLDFVQDDMEQYDQNIPSLLSTHQSNIDSYTGTTNSNLLSLLSIQSSLKDSREAVIDADTTIKERELSLTKLKAGADELDIKSQELTIQQRENALTDAKNALANYYVRAPFAGTIATIGAKKYDNAGSGTAIATLITNKKIAELSLNEVDAAKVNVGDKATLTFDAIESLTLTGEVAEIDAIGTVTQGVVSYKVKIGFDSQDERIKSGMTANASIQIDVRQDVLAIPSSAVKTQNGISYVQIFNPALSSTNGTQGVVSNTPPQQVEVTVGISDDINVEILSGLEEGQQIVTRTVTGSATTNTTPANNTRGGGLGGTGIRF